MCYGELDAADEPRSGVEAPRPSGVCEFNSCPPVGDERPVASGRSTIAFQPHLSNSICRVGKGGGTALSSRQNLSCAVPTMDGATCINSAGGHGAREA